METEVSSSQKAVPKIKQNTNRYKERKVIDTEDDT